jgi:hypothetical protein
MWNQTRLYQEAESIAVFPTSFTTHQAEGEVPLLGHVEPGDLPGVALELVVYNI